MSEARQNLNVKHSTYVKLMDFKKSMNDISVDACLNILVESYVLQRK